MGGGQVTTRLVPIPGYPHLTLAACHGCGVAFGVAANPAVRWALRRHLRDCPAAQPCPRCGCEGELSARTHGWELRCEDCWVELLEVVG
jgi:hypothetical protein